MTAPAAAARMSVPSLRVTKGVQTFQCITSGEPLLPHEAVFAGKPNCSRFPISKALFDLRFPEGERDNEDQLVRDTNHHRDSIAFYLFSESGEDAEAFYCSVPRLTAEARIPELAGHF